MSEDINLMIEKLYQNATRKIYQVYDVFKDYFDEERVDIQDIETLELFKQRLSNKVYSEVINRTFILESNAWNNTSEQDKEIIKALLNERVLSTFICSDETAFKYLFPFLLEKYDTSIYNETAYIIVRFPEVRVSNENDKYVDIKELYARVKVNGEGKIQGTFGLARADYPVSHIYADYAHSHIPGLTLEENQFKSPCLGSGPINRTICSLVEEGELSSWMLFCRELDVYVTVESLSGVPHRKLENITGDKKLRKIGQQFSNFRCVNYFKTFVRHRNFPREELKGFITYLISKDTIKFSRSNGTYYLGMGFKDFIISVSNAFIDYVNNRTERTEYNKRIFNISHLTYIDMLKPYVIKDGIIYSMENRIGSLESTLGLSGRTLFKFKDSEVKLNIYDGTSRDEDNIVYLLNPNFCEELLTYLIIYLNYANSKKYANSQIGFDKKHIII